MIGAGQMPVKYWVKKMHSARDAGTGPQQLAGLATAKNRLLRQLICRTLLVFRIEKKMPLYFL